LFWGLTTQHVRHVSDETDDESRPQHGTARAAGSSSATSAPPPRLRAMDRFV
jgi:hypothetical protein